MAWRRRLVLVVLLCAASVYGLSWDEAGLGEWSDDFYPLVEDVMGSVDHYAQLGITEEASMKDVKRAWREAIRTKHPDKVKGVKEKEIASLEFIEIIRANDVLSDERLRRVYDHFRNHGVPWEKRFYGRYAHRYGVPEVALWKVITFSVVVASGVHYFVLKTRYERYMRLAQQSPAYQTKLRLLQQQARDELNEQMTTGEAADGEKAKRSVNTKKKKKKKKKRMAEVEEECEAMEEEVIADVAPEIEIKGLEAPGLWSLLPIKIARSVWRLIWFIGRDWIMDRLLGYRIDREAIFRKAEGLEDDADWEDYLAEREAKIEKFMKSNKAKRYRRLMRKYR